MQPSTTAGLKLAAIFSLTALAACSAGTQMAPPASGTNPYLFTHTVNGHILQRSFSVLPPALQEQLARQSAMPVKPDQQMQPDTCFLQPALTPKVYVTQYGANNVRLYRQGLLTPAGTAFPGLTNPQGIDVHNQRVYVANSGGSDIRIFNRCGVPIPSATIPMSGYPMGLALDTAGDVYVTAVAFTGVTEVRYFANASGSGVVIGDPNLQPYFVTVDSHHNVFVSGIGPNGAEVDWCHNAATNCTSAATWTNTGIAINFPGGLRIDATGNLIVNDQQGSTKVYSVPNFAQVGASIPCGGATCVDFGLSAAGNRLFIADATGKAWRENYPSGAGTVTFGPPGLSPAGQPVSAAAWPGPAWGG